MYVGGRLSRPVVYNTPMYLQEFQEQFLPVTNLTRLVNIVESMSNAARVSGRNAENAEAESRRLEKWRYSSWGRGKSWLTKFWSELSLWYNSGYISYYSGDEDVQRFPLFATPRRWSRLSVERPSLLLLRLTIAENTK